jgi:hypothetical protein
VRATCNDHCFILRIFNFVLSTTENKYSEIFSFVENKLQIFWCDRNQFFFKFMLMGL